VLRSPWVVLGLLILGAFVLAALLAPWLAPYDPARQAPGFEHRPPSAEHFLGQDQLGRDILSRLLYGARISLRVGVMVVLLAGSVGVLLGLISGYFGGLVDTLLMRVVDILLAFPGLLLAIALVAVLGPDVNNVVLALSALGWVSFARLVRGQVLAVKERDFVLAARTSGQSDLRIMLIHLLPNVLSPVIVQATFGIASVILAEASLSFLGLGAPVGTPSWGVMLSDGKEALFQAPHMSIFPGIAIMLVVLSLNLVGDGLRDWLDPRTSSR
jgi:peptide/nickel transport system permease protein